MQSEDDAQSLLAPGDLIDGRFEVVRWIAAGSYASVFEARDLDRGVPAAIKVMRRNAVLHAPRIRRAATLAMERLHHPSIVRILAVGEFSTPTRPRADYVAMEYVEGTTLAAELKKAPVPLREAREFIDPVLAAVAHAHAQGVTHRDISPNNVLVDDAGFPHLTDFDLLRHRHTAGGTRKHEPMGTPGYCAPELDDAASASRAVDIYSIGVLLHELLTGALPKRDDVNKRVELVDPDNRLDDSTRALLESMLRWHHEDRANRAWTLRVRLAKLVGIALPDSPERLEGLRLDDRLDIELFVGEGGMATVYRAHDAMLDRIVALKLARDAWTQQAQEAFQHEARIAGSLEHDNVVRVYDAGAALLDGTREHYLLLRYMPGGSLASRLVRGIPTISDALGIAADLAEALCHLNDRGVVHRDIKPGNILFDESGRAQLADFSISYRVADGPPRDEVHPPASPGYEPPELLESPSRSGHFTDAYQFGLVLYELVTGVLPCDGRTGHMHDVLTRTGDGFRPSDEPTAIPDAHLLDDLVEALTHPAYRNRPSAEEVRLAIEAIDINAAAPPSSALLQTVPTAPPVSHTDKVSDKHPLVDKARVGARTWLIQGAEQDSAYEIQITVPRDPALDIPSIDDAVAVATRTSISGVGVVTSATETSRGIIVTATLDPLARPVRITQLPLELRLDAAEGRTPPFAPSGRFSGHALSPLSARIAREVAAIAATH